MPKLTAIVTALILERPLCFHCLGDKSGASRPEIASVLRTVAGTVIDYLRAAVPQVRGDRRNGVHQAARKLSRARQVDRRRSVVQIAWHGQ